VILGEVSGVRRKYSKGALGIPLPPLTVLGDRGCYGLGDTFPPQNPTRPFARGVDGRCWTAAGLPFPGDGGLAPGGFLFGGVSPVHWSAGEPDQCDVDCWTADLTGWVDYPPLQTFWDMERIGECAWLYDGLPSPSGEDSHVELFEDFDGFDTYFVVNVHVTIDVDGGLESNANYRILKTAVSFSGTTNLDLVDSSGPWAVPATLSITPCSSGVTVLSAGGFRLGGESPVSDWLIRSAGGVRMGAESAVGVSVLSAGGVRCNGTSTVYSG